MALARRLSVVRSNTKGAAMTPKLRVAFATNDRRAVNQHFGSAESFIIYDLDGREALLAEVCQFGELAQDGNENKLAAKLEALAACDAVYANAVGGSAVAQLKSMGIQAMKVEAGEEIAHLVAGLQEELLSGAGWAAKAVARKSVDASRFDAMEAEGWEE